jgi:hypothetical protein
LSEQTIKSGTQKRYQFFGIGGGENSNCRKKQMAAGDARIQSAIRNPESEIDWGLDPGTCIMYKLYINPLPSRFAERTAGGGIYFERREKQTKQTHDRGGSG